MALLPPRYYCAASVLLLRCRCTAAALPLLNGIATTALLLRCLCAAVALPTVYTLLSVLLFRCKMSCQSLLHSIVAPSRIMSKRIVVSEAPFH
jgi:hypothetical protein